MTFHKAFLLGRVVPALCAALAVLPASAQNPITLAPGDDIQQAVASASENTVFILQPGVYRLQSIQPANGDIFIGQPGAVLNGSTLLPPFGVSGNLWVAAGPSGQGQPAGNCDAAHPQCQFNEDLFFDNRPLLHVGSIDAVVSGAYYIDYSNGAIYIADNPTGHTVEVATASGAFQGQASNVNVVGLVVEKYADPAQAGAIGGQNPGPGWVVVNNEVRLNHGTGISLGAGSRASQNNVHDNGEKGIGGAADNILVEYNEIARNNYAGFDPTWEAGGAKFAVANGLVLRGNNVHDNNGPGLWCDIDSMNALIEGNTVTSNTGGAGIQYEISYNATIRNNTVRYNSLPNSGWWMWGSQILIQNSANSQVYGNTVEVSDNGNAIGIVNQDRGSGPYGVREATGNYIHNNTIVVRTSGHGNTGLVADFDVQKMLTSGNNLFDYNTYHVADTGQWQYAWVQNLTWDGFQQAGQENHGTIDAQLPPE